MICDCNGWRESMPQIEGAQQFAALHGIQYKGEVFRYCPWCSKKLVVSKSIIPEETCRHGISIMSDCKECGRIYQKFV